MAAPRISEIEKPGERRLNIETLLRIASGLDIGLDVNFLPFSELVDRSENFDPDTFGVRSFEEEIADLEKAAKHPDQKVLTTGYTSFAEALIGRNPFDAWHFSLPTLGNPNATNTLSGFLKLSEAIDNTVSPPQEAKREEIENLVVPTKDVKFVRVQTSHRHRKKDKKKGPHAGRQFFPVANYARPANAIHH
jgi:hypothetical protein